VDEHAFEDEEQYLIFQLERLKKAYMKDAQPYIDRLIKIRDSRPQPPMFLNTSGMTEKQIEGILGSIAVGK
jgi:hypothetical protein